MVGTFNINLNNLYIMVYPSIIFALLIILGSILYGTDVITNSQLGIFCMGGMFIVILSFFIGSILKKFKK